MKKIITLSGDFNHGRVLMELFDGMEVARERMESCELKSDEYFDALNDYKAARNAWEDWRDGRVEA